MLVIIEQISIVFVWCKFVEFSRESSWSMEKYDKLEKKNSPILRETFSQANALRKVSTNSWQILWPFISKAYTIIYIYIYTKNYNLRRMRTAMQNLENPLFLVLSTSPIDHTWEVVYYQTQRSPLMYWSFI